MGTTKFTLFYALGVILNMVYGMVTHSGVNMYYIHMSMFFSFATLCAMLTGHIIALPAFYAIFNFIVWLIELITEITQNKITVLAA